MRFPFCGQNGTAVQKILQNLLTHRFLQQLLFTAQIDIFRFLHQIYTEDIRFIRIPQNRGMQKCMFLQVVCNLKLIMVFYRMQHYFLLVRIITENR